MECHNLVLNQNICLVWLTDHVNVKNVDQERKVSQRFAQFLLVFNISWHLQFPYKTLTFFSPFFLKFIFVTKIGGADFRYIFYCFCFKRIIIIRLSRNTQCNLLFKLRRCCNVTFPHCHMYNHKNYTKSGITGL